MEKGGEQAREKEEAAGGPGEEDHVRELGRKKQADKLEWGLVRAAPSPQFPRPLSLWANVTH